MWDVFLSKFALRRFSLLILIGIFLNSAYAYKDESPISFGSVELGENRLPLKPKHFNIEIKKYAPLQIKTKLKKDSLQWVRFDEVMLMPRARYAIYIKGNPENYHFRYRGKSVLAQNYKGYAHSEFYVSLFHHDPIQVYYKTKVVASISFTSKVFPKYKDRLHLIDYSCNRRNIKVTGLEGELLSVGCKMHRIGKIGSEKPMLEVMWTSPNWTLLDNSRAPYMAVFFDNVPIKVKVKNKKGMIKTVTIKANVPKRMHRLGIAMGIGPYAFETNYKGSTKTEPLAPAIMGYFNFQLDDETSIRGFDALILKDSLFNNAGIYLANDIASVLDNKLTFTTLIGLQHLYFQFDADSSNVSDVIFPQGIEFLYRHAFGITDYIIGGGAFFKSIRNSRLSKYLDPLGKRNFLGTELYLLGSSGRRS
jgi:hypothetical protein